MKNIKIGEIPQAALERLLQESGLPGDQETGMLKRKGTEQAGGESACFAAHRERDGGFPGSGDYAGRSQDVRN